MRHPASPLAPSGQPTPAVYATVVGVEGALSDGAQALAPAAALAAGSRLALAGDGHVELALARGTRVRIAGPARVVLGGNPRAVALSLEQGTLDAEVAHRLSGETFAIVTHDLRVEVRGTRFSVGVVGAGSWVRVAEGRVEVRLSDGSVRAVSAGEALDSPRPPVPSLAPSPPPLPTPSSSPGASASASASGQPSDAPVSCADATSACEGVAREARDRMRAGEQSAALHLLSSWPRHAGPSCSGAAAVACQDELGYLRAEALRGVGRIDDAILAYRRLDRHGKPAAMRQNALYAAGELERRRGHAARARGDYERALAAAPRGALREEAMLGAMDSAAAAADRAGALAWARRYLDEFPAGIGAARARGLRDGGGP